MNAEFRIVHSAGDDWDVIVGRTTHDIYHLRGYGRACEVHEGRPVDLAVVDNGSDLLVLPIIVRQLPEDLPDSAPFCDVTVPYGYPSPVSTASSVDAVRPLLRSLVAGLRSLGAVSLFARCNPFVGIPREAWVGLGTVVTHGEHVWIDVPTATAADRPFRYGHRSEIRKLERAGFEKRSDAPGSRHRFAAIYRETMKRLGADPYYLFPDAYFDVLFRELGSRARVIEVVAPGGDVAAAALLLTCGEIAQYHLSGTVGEFLKMAPAKLTVPAMIKACNESGVRRLNLGSGTGGRADGLFKFKAGFSPLRAPFESVRVVLDESRYAQFSRGVDAPEGFFPAYRSGY